MGTVMVTSHFKLNGAKRCVNSSRPPREDSLGAPNRGKTSQNMANHRRSLEKAQRCGVDALLEGLKSPKTS